MPAVLVKAIQQQQEQIDKLVADNDNLRLKHASSSIKESVHETSDSLPFYYFDDCNILSALK